MPSEKSKGLLEVLLHPRGPMIILFYTTGASAWISLALKACAVVSNRKPDGGPVLRSWWMQVLEAALLTCLPAFWQPWRPWAAAWHGLPEPRGSYWLAWRVWGMGQTQPRSVAGSVRL